MAQLNEFIKQLKPGRVYRRAEIINSAKLSNRHLKQLQENGILQKLYAGIYFCPKESTFGNVPPEENDLIRCFLKGERFLLHSFNSYNSLGVGTTQLYNQRIIYNHKRHGNYKLGNRVFHFCIRIHFPKKLTEEFLLIDLVNNIYSLAEDRNEVLKHVFSKACKMNKQKIRRSISMYGNAKTKRFFASLL